MVHATMDLSEKTDFIIIFFYLVFTCAWRLLKALEEPGYRVSISLCLCMIQQV